MSKLNIELANILPIDLIQVMPKSMLGTETVPKLQNMQHTAWTTSPLFLKNPLTVARIIETLNRSGFTGYGNLTSVGVKTNDGEGIVFSCTSMPIQQTMQYPLNKEDGTKNYSGVQFPETKCVWDIIAQCMAENEPLLGAGSENNLEHFATQGVTTFKTIVNCSDTSNGTVRGLIIESGIVCTNNLENANQIAVSIDSKVLVNTDDIMNPFTFKPSEQFVGLDKENVTEVE